MNSAGMVKIVPLASDVEADPIVCDRLASRIVPARAEQTEQRDRHHGGGNRRRHGETDAKAKIGVCRAEHDAEQHAGDDRLDREFGDVAGCGLCRMARHAGDMIAEASS